MLSAGAVSPQAHYSTGRASASFTSTAMAPETTRTAQVVSSPHSLSAVAEHRHPPARPALWACRQLTTSGQAGTGPFESGLVSGWGRPAQAPATFFAGSHWPGPLRPQPLPPLPVLAPGARPPGSPTPTGRQLRRLLVATIDEDELRYQFVKKKGYVRLHTNLGDLNLELHCDLVRGCPPPPHREPSAAAGGQAHQAHRLRPATGPGAPPTVEAAVWLTGAFGLSDPENL